MRPGVLGQRRSPPAQGNRRLVGAVLVSLLVHGLILSLQFGIPALGLPGSATPIEVRLADVAEQPVPPLDAPVPVAPLPLPSPLPEPGKPLAPAGGMRLIDPVPAPIPAPAPVPTPVTPRLAVKKDKPRKAKRISPPLPATDALAMDSRVMVQDSVLNDFAVPMPRPEEAEQKTIDLKEAQHGTDDGTEATSAAEVAEAARAAQEAETRRQEEQAEQLAAQRKREKEEEEARRLAELQARQQQDTIAAAAAETARSLEKQARVAQQAQMEADAARERASLVKAEQQKTEQLALERKLEQQKSDQLKAEQQRVDQQRVDQQKADLQKAEQLRADQQKVEQQKLEQEKAEQLRAEQAKAERQRAEQLAAQQQAAQKLAEQQAAQKAAEQRAAQKLAEQAARKKADQAAQAAETARQAALQGGREGGGTQAANTPAGGSAAGAGSGAGGKAVIPKNLLSSELSNRAREMVKGLDILSGTPPPPMRDERRVAVGAAERDLPLRMYVESWRQKIERNGSANYPRGWADVEHTHALVNVAVRSDGTVQDVTILRSSGRADMDEAVLRIVRVNARYAPFPPNIASRYDVIDIRRVWQFGDNLKLMEEVR
ncbi:TonB family protein [Massilia violaceinigra]|uniref:TonB family protein n=1 Tax=Massilia violaceinigra TaxID=2045208 RepID=A0ABY4A135_9BURK|nr:TonB family protein [Massilia violaceinigra]UOD28474.1 TonB family protein [Massilia violaceinigra]